MHFFGLRERFPIVEVASGIGERISLGLTDSTDATETGEREAGKVFIVFYSYAYNSLEPTVVMAPVVKAAIVRRTVVKRKVVKDNTC